MVASTVDRWNALYGEDFRITRFEGKGSASDEMKRVLYGFDSSSYALAPDPETSELKLLTVSELLSNSPSERSEVTIGRLRQFAEQLTEEVSIEWQVGDQSFYTRGLVGDNWPYFLDTMVMSIILAERPATTFMTDRLCYEQSLVWISGIKIGEISANYISDLYFSPIDGNSFTCEVVLSEFYNLAGEIAYIEENTVYTGDSCRTHVTYGYAGPFATVKVAPGGVGVEFGGLGFQAKKEFVCRYP
jgi:hypothetical protein